MQENSREAASKAVLLKRLSALKMWGRGGKIAPHKPLLVLYALGQFARGTKVIPFVDVDKKLGQLLRDFGGNLKSIHTEYPFWRLQNDKLWNVEADAPLLRQSSNSDPKKSALRELHARGSFPDEIQRLLETHPEIIGDAAQALLTLNFPESLHAEIAAAVGLTLDSWAGKARRRDPEFRRKVLRAYGFRCCVCGYDLRLGNIFIGIEAAHIKWHQAGGPDTESNGLSLCTMHHKAFDLGVYSLTPRELILVVSQELVGGEKLGWLLDFHGKTITPPQSEGYLPRQEYLIWHNERIFKHPGKEIQANRIP